MGENQITPKIILKNFIQKIPDEILKCSYLLFSPTIMTSHILQWLPAASVGYVLKPFCVGVGFKTKAKSYDLLLQDKLAKNIDFQNALKELLYRPNICIWSFGSPLSGPLFMTNICTQCQCFGSRFRFKYVSKNMFAS